MIKAMRLWAGLAARGVGKLMLTFTDGALTLMAIALTLPLLLEITGLFFSATGDPAGAQIATALRAVTHNINLDYGALLNIFASLFGLRIGLRWALWRHKQDKATAVDVPPAAAPTATPTTPKNTFDALLVALRGSTDPRFARLLVRLEETQSLFADLGRQPLDILDCFLDVVTDLCAAVERRESIALLAPDASARLHDGVNCVLDFLNHIIDHDLAEAAATSSQALRLRDIRVKVLEQTAVY